MSSLTEIEKERNNFFEQIDFQIDTYVVKIKNSMS